MTDTPLIRRQVTDDRGLPERKRGRPSTIGKLIMIKAQFYRTVAELAKETGATPDCVRKVLRNAADKGEIHLKRFVKGKSGRAMMVKG